MANLLLLYDLEEKDLARDFKDLLDELNIGSIIMIPLSPNKGLTLEEKEKSYFAPADGAIFIVTPGSERLGSIYPSPSVAHEMGQAKQKFQGKPESVIYLVDKACNLPAIDQKCRIIFERQNIRSVLAALTQLMKDLKVAGLFRTTPVPTQTAQESKKISLEDFSKSLGEQIKQVIWDISNRPDGCIYDSNLEKFLTQKYHLNVQEINLLKRDLAHKKVVNPVTNDPRGMAYWQLTPLGWDIVRLEVEKRKKAAHEQMNALAKALGGFLGRPIQRSGALGGASGKKTSSAPKPINPLKG